MSLDPVWGLEPCLGKQGHLLDPWEGELGYHFGLSIHWKVKVSVLGTVGASWSRLETSQSPRCLLSWVDKIPPPPLKSRLWWAAWAAVAAAFAQVWVVALRAHRVLLRPSDGGSRSGGEVGEAVSSSAGTRSCQTAARCCGCWLCLKPRRCYRHWGSPSRSPLEEEVPRYCQQLSPQAGPQNPP